MKAEDLRIGNLVLGASRGKVITVTSSIIDQVDRGLLVVGGISITEEWLTRFGFKGTKSLIGKGNFLYNKQTKVLTWFGVPLADNLLDEVHKLQNLWHSLTGEELQIIHFDS